MSRLNIIGLLSIALLTACGDTEDSQAKIEDICTENGGAFVALVDKLFECSPEFALFIGDAPSTTEVSAACEAQLAPFVEDGTVQLGEKSDLDACLTAIAAADCTTFDIDNLVECEDITSGLIEDGESCESDDQCAGDAYCDDSQNATCGVCATQLADGATCDDSSVCLNGKCLSDGTCGSFAQAGDTCTDSDDCIGRLVCDGTCGVAEESSAGDSCTEFAQCGFPFSGLFCNEQAAVCTAFLAVGDECFDGTAATGACDIIQYESCDFLDTAKCVAPTIVQLNDDCGFATGLKCSDGLVCEGGDEGICAEPGVGKACDLDAEVNTCGLFLECKDDSKCNYETNHSGMCPAN